MLLRIREREREVGKDVRKFHLEKASNISFLFMYIYMYYCILKHREVCCSTYDIEVDFFLELSFFFFLLLSFNKSNSEKNRFSFIFSQSQAEILLLDLDGIENLYERFTTSFHLIHHLLL